MIQEFYPNTMSVLLSYFTNLYAHISLAEASVQTMASYSERVEELFAAIEAGDVDEVRELVESRGVSSNSIHNGRPALISAVAKAKDNDGPRLRLIETLLRNGADPDQKEDDDTALLVATMMGNFQAAELLIGAGADPNVQDNAGHTALMIAGSMARGDDYAPSLRLIETLLRNGADSSIVDRKGRTAAVHARKLIHRGSGVTLPIIEERIKAETQDLLQASKRRKNNQTEPTPTTSSRDEGGGAGTNFSHFIL